MSEEQFQKNGLHERLASEVGPVDILVGIPSYNNAGTIGGVVQAVSAGLAKYFPDARAILVNSDGGSVDGTPQIVAEASVDLKRLLVPQHTNPLHKITTPYHGISGKGSAFRTIFQIAEKLEVKACAVVDADLRSITPEWIELLLQPIMKWGYDYVAPYYRRHKYDGTITNNIIYPLTRALYGKRLRQPIGGDFGFTADLAHHFLTKDVWETDVARYGIDIWMTTTAMAKGSNICQVYLGAKIHDHKDPGSDLSAMLIQVMGSVFSLMNEYDRLWKGVDGSGHVPLFGFQYDVGLEPIQVDVDPMLDTFNLGLTEFFPIWEEFLSKEVLEELWSLRDATRENLNFSDRLWVKLIYDFAVSAHRRALSLDQLLKTFQPLYLGRVASFILETQYMNNQTVETRIEKLCQVFEKEKSCLVTQWDGISSKGGLP